MSFFVKCIIKHHKILIENEIYIVKNIFYDDQLFYDVMINEEKSIRCSANMFVTIHYCKTSKLKEKLRKTNNINLKKIKEKNSKYIKDLSKLNVKRFLMFNKFRKTCSYKMNRPDSPAVFCILSDTACDYKKCPFNNKDYSLIADKIDFNN